jgi:carbon-monoxide dehydrogenase large subunit
MSILGNRVRRSEDSRFITGTGQYGDDLKLDNALYATFVRSLVPHARINSIDTSGIDQIPGARVFTGQDLPFDSIPVGMPMYNEAMSRPVMTKDVVRFVGDIVAVVLTEDRLQGPDAAELVFADLEELPPVPTVEAALEGDSLLFPDAGTNVVWGVPESETGDAFFEDCDVVVSTKTASQRLASCPIECRAAAAEWSDDGRLTFWASTQTPNRNKEQLAGNLGIDEEKVRVIVPDVGGGFGSKSGASTEDIIVAWCARETGRPVRWAETRGEDMLALPHGRAQQQEITIGGTRDGKVLAYRLKLLQDSGAYPQIGAVLPDFTAKCSSGSYAIPKIEVEFKSVVTNTTPIDPYRGAGRPEAIQAIERAMDMFAAEIEMDPAEVRRKNLIPADAFPYTTASGAEYDSGDYPRALDMVLAKAGYDELRAEQKRRRENGDAVQMGIGVSTYIEITNPMVEPEWGAVEITADGGAIVRSGLGPTGQGHQTTLAMLASDRLGIPFDQIKVVTGDTDQVPRGTGTYGSRSLQAGGSAVAGASEAVLEKAKELAAEQLEASAEDIRLQENGGGFQVAGSPEPSLSWKDLAAAADGSGRLAELSLHHDFEPSGIAWPFGAHVAVIDLDTETGKVQLKRFVCVDDCGTILNPLLVEGQRHGGIAQGAAQALGEWFAYDENAQPQTDNFVTYPVISAAELPSFELDTLETPTPMNGLGAKGIGESGTIGSTPAVFSAVLDALRPLGVKDFDMPATPMRVWQAIEAARA